MRADNKYCEKRIKNSNKTVQYHKKPLFYKGFRCFIIKNAQNVYGRGNICDTFLANLHTTNKYSFNDSLTTR